jgi:hypothetical protein
VSSSQPGQTDTASCTAYSSSALARSVSMTFITFSSIIVKFCYSFSYVTNLFGSVTDWFGDIQDATAINDFPLFDIICILFSFYSILLLLIALFILFIPLLLLSSLLLIFLFLLLLLSIYLSHITHKSSQFILHILYRKTVHYFLPNIKTLLSIVSHTFSSQMWL